MKPEKAGHAASTDRQSAKHSRRGRVQRDMMRIRACEQGVLYVVPPHSMARGGTTRQRETQEQAVVIIEVGGINFALRSAEDRQQVMAGYQALLKALPSDQSLQLLVCSQRQDLQGYLSRVEAVMSDEEAPATWRKLASAHADHVRHITENRSLPGRRFYVVLSSAPSRTVPSWRMSVPWRQGARRSSALTHTREALRKQLEVQCENIMAQLVAMGLTARRLSDKELVCLAYRCLTPERSEQFPLPSPGNLDGPRAVPLADMLAPASVEERPEWMCVEGEYTRCLAITAFPREVTVGWLAPLMLDDSMIDIVQFFHPQNPQTMIRRYRRRKAEFRATRQINRKRGVVDDPEEEVAAGDVEKLLSQLASREERLFEVGMYILVRATDRATLDERTTHVMTVLKNLFVVARPTTFEQLPALLSAQPYASDLLRRTCLLDTRSLATAMPFISDALYMPDGVLEGITSNGKPVVIDDWDDALDNPHRFIGAITGAGKSYSCKLKMLRESLVRYSENMQIAVIDPEQEYERMCREVGGTRVRLAPGSQQHLNPFDLVPPGINLEQYCTDRSHGDRLAEKVQSLHTLYDFMLSDRGPTGATTLSVREKGLLDRATYEIYRAVNITADPATHLHPAPLLKDLYNVLVSGVCGKDAYGLADRLYRFVEGSLAGTFSAPTDVALADRFVVFDILDMAGELRPIGIFLIADCMWTQVLASHRPRVLYIDEAWSLIQHPEGGRFLADMARRARKRYLRIVTITQSPELFVENQWGAVIAGNAATKMLKKQDHTSVPAVASRFQLTRAERQKLLTLAKSEALLLTGGNHLVLTVEANPLEHRLATTNPRDIALFAHEMEGCDGQ